MVEVNKLTVLLAEAKKRANAGDRRDISVHAEDVEDLAKAYLTRHGEHAAHISAQNIANDIRAGRMKVFGLTLAVTNIAKPPPPAFAPRAIRRKL